MATVPNLAQDQIPPTNEAVNSSLFIGIGATLQVRMLLLWRR